MPRYSGSWTINKQMFSFLHRVWYFNFYAGCSIKKKKTRWKAWERFSEHVTSKTPRLVENATVSKNRFLQYLPIVRYSIGRIARRNVVFQLVDARGQRLRSRGKKERKKKKGTERAHWEIEESIRCVKQRDIFTCFNSSKTVLFGVLLFATLIESLPPALYLKIVPIFVTRSNSTFKY